MNDSDQRPFEPDPETGLPIGPRVDPTPARPPEPVVLEGRYARLEPLGPEHLPGLFEISTGPGTPERFLYLADLPPKDLEDVERWLAGADHGGERLGFAVVDRSSGRVGGRFFLMSIVPVHRRIEAVHLAERSTHPPVGPAWRSRVSRSGGGAAGRPRPPGTGWRRR